MPNQSSKFSVFIVDDEPAIAASLAQVLAHEGYETRSFVDSQAVLKAATEAVPHLLIADMLMPHLSGVQLAIRLREISPHCKFLFFSGQVSTADYFSKGYNGPHVKIHQKPLHIPELLASIKALNLGERHLDGIYLD